MSVYLYPSIVRKEERGQFRRQRCGKTKTWTGVTTFKIPLRWDHSRGVTLLPSFEKESRETGDTLGHQ